MYKNQILSVGYNTNKTHPLQKKYNKFRNINYDNVEPIPFLHAEMSCLLQIREMDIDFNKVELYIYREDRNGNLSMCRPCKACMKMIDTLGIKNIYYTTNNGYAKEVRKIV